MLVVVCYSWKLTTNLRRGEMCRNSCAWYLEVGSVDLGLDSDFEEER